jgi:membrane associated rhomboid family serine protease
MSKRFKTAVSWSVGLLLLIWGVFIFDLLTGSRLSFWYGLHTRELAGLKGIVTAPLLHGGWSHLISNSFPFLSLTGLLIFFYPRLWPRVLLLLWIGTGVLVWTLGRPVTHIGASGVVYALAAFLGFSGFFRRDMRAVVVSLLVLFYYGSMVVGILPGQEGISWESHLLGLVMGVGTAYGVRKELEDHEIEAKNKKANRYADQEDEERPFLDPTTFTATKQEKEQADFWEKIKQAAGNKPD